MEKVIQIEKGGTTYDIVGEYTPPNNGSSPPEPAEFEPEVIYQKNEIGDIPLYNVTPTFDSFGLWDDIQDLINEEIKNLD